MISVRSVEELGIRPIPSERFVALADLLALRRRPGGEWYASNYLRGPLLHALVTARRPKTVIEFGTGRGYGAAAMARAMVEAAIDGVVYTIDRVGPDEDIEWPYDDGNGPRVEPWSRRRFWARYLPGEWIDRIVSLTGSSRDVMARWSADIPPIDMAFVDGGHDHATVRHDLMAAASIGSDRLGVLLDDFAKRPGFGVVRAVTELSGERIPIRVVPTDWGHGTGGPGQGMAWIDLAMLPEERARLAALHRRTGLLARVRSALPI